MCSPDLILGDAAKLSQTLLLPTIAVFGAYIAYQQWKTNHAGLREKLFEKRFQVFKEAQIFLSEIIQYARLDDESLWKFNDTCQRARFLYDIATYNYLQEIRNRAIKMKMHQEQAQNPRNESERPESVEKAHVELLWLTDQINPFFGHFEPFLGFGKIK